MHPRTERTRRLSTLALLATMVFSAAASAQNTDEGEAAAPAEPPAPAPAEEAGNEWLDVGKQAAAIVGTAAVAGAAGSGVIVYGLINFSATATSLDPSFFLAGLALIALGVVGTPAAIAGAILLAGAVTQAGFIRALPAVALGTVGGVLGLAAGYALFSLAEPSLRSLPLPGGFPALLVVPTVVAVAAGAVGGAAGAAAGLAGGVGADLALAGKLTE